MLTHPLSSSHHPRLVVVSCIGLEFMKFIEKLWTHKTVNSDYVVKLTLSIFSLFIILQRCTHFSDF